MATMRRQAVYWAVMITGCSTERPTSTAARAGTDAGARGDAQAVEEGTGEIIGVVRLGGQPLARASVKVGQREATTGMDGRFSLRVPAGPAVIVQANGPTTSTTRVRIAVLAETTSSLVLTVAPTSLDTLASAEAGGVVTTREQLRITFPPGALALADGTPYSGEVSVRSTVLRDPQDLAAAPGQMLATTDTGEDIPLESFAMAEVRLVSARNEPLVLTKSATIAIPLMAMPPSAEPSLYTFDEASARWRQVGKGRVVGSEFQAVVDHFSWWNCDEPLTDKSCIKGRLATTGGGVLANVPVSAYGLSYRGASYANTDAQGDFCLNVKRDSRAEVSMFFPGPAHQGTWSTTVQSGVSPVSCEADRGNCVDLATVSVAASAFTCIRGHLGLAPAGHGFNWRVRDAQGRTVATGQARAAAGSDEFCVTLPQGETIDFTVGESAGACAGASKGPLAMTNPEAICAAAGSSCQTITEQLCP